jgi:cobalt-zinc-cadmium efflux system outer membrane protein
MEPRLEQARIGRRRTRLYIVPLLSASLASGAWAQKTLTWEQAKQEFEVTNPNLRAARIGIQESRAEEITAFLRPNPDVTIAADQFTFFNGNPYRPFTDVEPTFAISYLIERRHKRQLRRESAQGATAIAISQLDDEERTLLFGLRTAFVQVLQQKAVLAVTRESLSYYDRVLGVSLDRLKAGDIAQIDFDRLDLQRVQFETDVQTALVNLRTAKIQFRALLNDQTAIDALDVRGAFDFTELITPLEEFRTIALDNRPDLRAAVQSVSKAKTDHKLAIANGSTDPTFGIDVARDPPIPAYIGFSIDFPLRIFDRNQGEKERTRLDIGRNERLVDATRAQIFSDVDSAYVAIQSNLSLLRPYRAKYLAQAVRVRETISFSYQHGGASLLDFLQSQQDYRSIQLGYLNLVGAYLTAVAQMSIAVGREVIL